MARFLQNDSTPDDGEHRFEAICRFVSNRLPKEDRDRLNETDWRRLAAVAVREGLGPLIYRAGENHGWPGSATAGVRQQVAAAYYRTLAYNGYLGEQLSQILTCLHRARIPVILLKGAALAATHYPEPGLRPMGDIDLLLPPECVEAAAQAVSALGYHPTHLAHSRKALQMVGRHMALRGGHNESVFLEIHWSLVGSAFDRRSPDMRWFWEQVVPWNGGEITGEAYTFNDGAHLLLVAGHLKQHGFARLIWLYDVHLLCNRWRPDEAELDRIARRACDFGWAGALLQMIESTGTLFSGAAPATLLAELRKRCPAAGGAFRLGLPAGKRTRSAKRWQLLVALRWRARLALIRLSFLPGSALLKHRYRPQPGWLWPGYYLFHWFDIFVDAVNTLIQSAPVSREKKRLASGLGQNSFDPPAR